MALEKRSEARTLREEHDYSHVGPNRGWIQWKGTNVCMDVHCGECGHHGHVDADFCYYVRCKACGTYYALNGYVKMMKLDAAPESTCIVETD